MTDTAYSFDIEQYRQSERLDIFLNRSVPTLSRSHIQKLIAAGLVTVNQKTVRANHKIQPGEHIEMIIPAAQPIDLAPEELPLHILYEDSDVIVVNKVRGMVVHPAAGNPRGTLVNALLQHCKDLSGINGDIRPGIVHRLDKDTTGVMVVAKNDQAHLHLAEQIRAHTAGRTYWAIVHGNIKEEAGQINAPIGRNPSERKKMAVTFTHSKAAVTKFKVLERFGDYTLVQCRLLTGRTHQIRVHMQYIGHPVVGDPQYGAGGSRFAIAGQALHSRELFFVHPVTGESLLFTAPAPEDFNRMLAQLRQGKA